MGTMADVPSRKSLLLRVCFADVKSLFTRAFLYISSLNYFFNYTKPHGHQLLFFCIFVEVKNYRKIMSYSKYTKLLQLRREFAINDLQLSWLPEKFPLFTPSNLLMLNLASAKEEALRSEKARSEYVISPIIKELRQQNSQRMSSFSGFELYVNKSLSGHCDFILSSVPYKSEVIAPIFCLVEAKRDDIEQGIAQCGAEMYAAHLFNEQEGTPKKQIFGCVTNAFSWCFLKLENKNLYIDPNYVPLTFTEPHRVLGVLQWILDESLKPYQP
jgi:hypothetical protein